MKNWKTCIGGERTTKGLTGMKIGLGPKPQKECNATGMFPNALRFP
jgi:hypothetical protein